MPLFLGVVLKAGVFWLSNTPSQLPPIPEVVVTCPMLFTDEKGAGGGGVRDDVVLTFRF